MKKLILLTLISLSANSYCAEIDSDDEATSQSSNKEFTVTGRVIFDQALGDTGAYFLEATNDNSYMLNDESIQKLRNKGNLGEGGKYTLKKIERNECIEYEIISFKPFPKLRLSKMRKAENQSEWDCTIL